METEQIRIDVLHAIISSSGGSKKAIQNYVTGFGQSVSKDRVGDAIDYWINKGIVADTGKRGDRFKVIAP